MGTILWGKILTHKKWLIAAIIVSVAVTASLVYRTNKSKPVAAAQTVKVQRGDIVSVVSATGSIQPVNMVDISSKITAQIKEVKVKENDQVKAGQVLVVLEDTGLKAQVTQAKERLDNAAVKYERTKRLTSIGASPEQDLDNNGMEYNIARANYDQVMSSLNETVITSPIDGTVIGKPLSAGEMVAQGVSNPTVILTVADMSRMQIEAQVDQTDIGKVVVGQKVTFTVDAYPGKTFTGTVALISKKPVTQQNVIYYPVTIDVNNAENLLNPGMVARVSIAISESKDTLTLPLAAVRTDRNGKYVVVMDQSGQTQNLTITTGNIGDDRVEIISGLSEGAKVVVSQPKGQGQTPAGATGGSQGGNPLNMMRRM
jgi:HlyD family secretion protein